MNTIATLGIVQCLFLTFLVLNKSRKSRQEYWLAIFLVFNALHLLFFYANFNTEYNKYQNVLLVGSCFPLLSGSIFFIYVSSLVHKQAMKLGHILLHFTPFIVFCSTLFYLKYNHPAGHNIQVFDGFVHLIGDFIWPVKNISIFFAISGGLYPLWTLFLLRRHTRNIVNEFSYFEKINLNWIKYWIVLYAASFVVGFLIILIFVDNNVSGKHVIAFQLITVIITGQVFFVGYYGFKQTTIFSNIDLLNHHNTADVGTHIKEEKYANTKLENAIAMKYVTRLQQLMLEEKPYLNSKLTIGLLASQMEIPSHHLSQIINVLLEKNFFDFVNEYRIEEIKDKINRPEFEHLTLLGIAYDCGFNSKSSFNSVFRKVTGFTPSQYKKQQTPVN